MYLDAESCDGVLLERLIYLEAASFKDKIGSPYIKMSVSGFIGLRFISGLDFNTIHVD